MNENAINLSIIGYILVYVYNNMYFNDIDIYYYKIFPNCS